MTETVDISNFMCPECGERFRDCQCADFFAAPSEAKPSASVPFPEDPVVEAVLSRMYDRAKRGMVEYGVSMEDEKRPFRQWIDDAIEELLDAALYLEKLKRLL
jgi:hypothetical protein